LLKIEVSPDTPVLKILNKNQNVVPNYENKEGKNNKLRQSNMVSS